MAMQRFTINLTQLRCIRESDAGPAEPYVWVTYFALGPQIAPQEPGPLAFYTPSYDNFRTEFKSMSAGDAVAIPPFLASASFDMDTNTLGPKLLGCVVVLMEENQTPQDDIIIGRIAFAKEIEKQLNALVKKRILENNTGPITKAEKEAIAIAVGKSVGNAIKEHLDPSEWLLEQDATIGFTSIVMTYSVGEPFPTAAFDFPEIIRRGDNGTVLDQFILSGTATAADIPSDFNRCARQQAAVQAKQRQIDALQRRVTLLQQQLQLASPLQKPWIIREIASTNAELSVAQSELPPLAAALQQCIDRFSIQGGTNPPTGIGL